MIGVLEAGKLFAMLVKDCAQVYCCDELEPEESNLLAVKSLFRQMLGNASSESHGLTFELQHEPENELNTCAQVGLSAVAPTFERHV